MSISYYTNDYIFKPSVRKHKKYDVFTLLGEYITSFGAIKENGVPYEQYRDNIGHYADKNHYDKDRRNRYFKSHGNKFKFESAGYFSALYLWN